MKKFKTFRTNNKGFTFIEVIVCIFILSITIAAFTALFAGSYSAIFGTGYKSRAVFEAQEKIERAVAEGEAGEEHDMTITFPGSPSVTIRSEGEIIKKNAEVNGQRFDVSTFVPY
ncbi:prepilin-type N-terminal cleavage/methylation domain-containing protein [Anaerobacterium chartisolvens]|uniref:Prepilin-type N-terminal cleavage/methylation domain-containing protein n=1 Tax=Anaerobacterium chartisolvens TaxID=1297424 RepID=A0A369AXA8_9FIRM|nr:prepilin-type N-terminal cleavage/methylation domain-containing protein [Anaerobacterium chartisolvens]RCX13793.1 prepilin-type N-terminal cleavage/methylation domain-containing protein [Anaerobacterium chartisolvens]